MVAEVVELEKRTDEDDFVDELEVELVDESVEEVLEVDDEVPVELVELELGLEELEVELGDEPV